MPKSWFEIRDEVEGQADIYLYDEIGSWGITANDFVQALRGIKAGIINLYVNSPGGDVFDGIAIHASLQRHPATVHAFIDSLAASSASFIVQAADRIVMGRNATMMIHEPYGMAIGNSETMAKMAETLGEVAENIADIYAERAGGTAEDWRIRMRAETWYRAQQAVDAGLADEVKLLKAPANLMPRFFNLSKFKNVPDWVKRSESEPEPIRDAGRTMSQSNLDKLHSAMMGLGSVHEGTCNMGGDCPMGMKDRVQTPILDEEWTAAYINDLPDSAFAVVLSGGEKDEDGKTTPRSLRKLPHHDKAGDVDVPHLRNALSREPQSDMPEDAHTKARSHLKVHAEKEGVGEDAEDNIDELIAAIERGLKEATQEVFGYV